VTLVKRIYNFSYPACRCFSALALPNFICNSALLLGFGASQMAPRFQVAEPVVESGRSMGVAKTWLFNFVEALPEQTGGFGQIDSIYME
jgi:hypothetical protein